MAVAASSCGIRCLLWGTWLASIVGALFFCVGTFLPLWYLPTSIYSAASQGSNYTPGVLGLYYYCPNLQGFVDVLPPSGLTTSCVPVDYDTCNVDVCLKAAKELDVSALPEYVQSDLEYNVGFNYCRTYFMWDPKPYGNLTAETDILYQLAVNFPGPHWGVCSVQKTLRILAPIGCCLAVLIPITSIFSLCCKLASTKCLGGLSAFLALMAAACAGVCAGLWRGLVPTRTVLDDGADPTAFVGQSFALMVIACVIELTMVPALCVWATLSKEKKEETYQSTAPPSAQFQVSSGAQAAARPITADGKTPSAV